MVNMPFSTLAELLLKQSQQSPEALAFLSPGRPPLNYLGLFEQVQICLGQLNSAGIGRNDTVAVVLPNGPEMAAAFLAIAIAATSDIESEISVGRI